MQAEALAVADEEAGEMVPLSLLRAGQTASVGEILGNTELAHRLREMGLCNGAKVKMVRQGSPCIICLGGQRLGFRCDELARVFVRVCGLAC